MVFMHDRRANRYFAQVAQDRVRVAQRGLLASAALVGSLGKELPFGQHGESGFGNRETVFHWCDGDTEGVVRCQE